MWVQLQYYYLVWYDIITLVSLPGLSLKNNDIYINSLNINTANMLKKKIFKSSLYKVHTILINILEFQLDGDNWTHLNTNDELEFLLNKTSEHFQYQWVNMLSNFDEKPQWVNKWTFSVSIHWKNILSKTFNYFNRIKIATIFHVQTSTDCPYIYMIVPIWLSVTHDNMNAVGFSSYKKLTGV